MPTGGWMVAGIALAVYILARLFEAMLNVWGKNPLKWAESKAAELAAPSAAQRGATNGVQGNEPGTAAGAVS